MRDDYVMRRTSELEQLGIGRKNRRHRRRKRTLRSEIAAAKDVFLHAWINREQYVQRLEEELEKSAGRNNKRHRQWLRSEIELARASDPTGWIEGGSRLQFSRQPVG
jgi:hypothetical protein